MSGTASDRICLVTGGTSGIGKATVRALAATGATVLVARNRAKDETTAEKIRRESGNDRVEVLVADLPPKHRSVRWPARSIAGTSGSTFS